MNYLYQGVDLIRGGMPCMWVCMDNQQSPSDSAALEMLKARCEILEEENSRLRNIVESFSVAPILLRKKLKSGEARRAASSITKSSKSFHVPTRPAASNTRQISLSISICAPSTMEAPKPSDKILRYPSLWRRSSFYPLRRGGNPLRQLLSTSHRTI